MTRGFRSLSQVPRPPRLPSAARRRSTGKRVSLERAGGSLSPRARPSRFPLHFSPVPPQRSEYLPLRAEIACKKPKLIYPFRFLFWYNRSVSDFLCKFPRRHGPPTFPSGAFHDRQSPIRTFCSSDGRTRGLCPRSVACTAKRSGRLRRASPQHHHKRKEVRA